MSDRHIPKELFYSICSKHPLQGRERGALQHRHKHILLPELTRLLHQTGIRTESVCVAGGVCCEPGVGVWGKKCVSCLCVLINKQKPTCPDVPHTSARPHTNREASSICNDFASNSHLKGFLGLQISIFLSFPFYILMICLHEFFPCLRTTQLVSSRHQAETRAKLANNGRISSTWRMASGDVIYRYPAVFRAEV